MQKMKIAFLPLFRALSRRITRPFLGTMFSAYRPERHYMRGPGPKWHERNSGSFNDERSSAPARQQLGVLNG
jgi:hypothetical protein